MESLMLFIDGSVDAKSKIGFGACLVVSESEIDLEELKTNVKLKRFEDTSSTKLELETLLWALDNISTVENKLIVYTDSQNIIGLPVRREKLKRNNFRSKNHKLLSNHELYKKLFVMFEKINCVFIKVKGHQKTGQKNKTDLLFTLVDRASRKALRDEFNSL